MQDAVWAGIGSPGFSHRHSCILATVLACDDSASITAFGCAGSGVCCDTFELGRIYEQIYH